MTDWSDMHEDLIRLILLQVPSDSLLSLARVSKALYRSSVSHIYQYVYISESLRLRGNSNYNPSLVPDWKSNHQQFSRKPPYHATRIFNSSLLLRTISESDQLRSYIMGASFNCKPDQEETVLPLIQALQPSLSSLHVKFSLDTLHRERQLLSTATHIEVEIVESQDIDYQTGDLKNIGCNEEICSYCNLPNIYLLSISGIRNWQFLTQNSTQQPKSSNVASLRLINTLPADPSLAKLLSWPKALKSLHFELKLSEVNDGFFEIGHTGFVPVLKAKEFSDSLQSQASSLEELFIYGDSQGDCSGGLQPTGTIDLHTFVSLRYVGLPVVFLIQSLSYANMLGVPIVPVVWSEILPPTLEVLQLEISEKFENYACSSYFSRDEEEYDEDFYPGQLGDLVCELVGKKETRFPKLRSIAIWLKGDGDVHALEDEQGCEEVIKACKAAGVKISWDESGIPPVFDGC